MRKYLFIFKKRRLKLILLALVSTIASIVGIVTVYYTGSYIDVVVEATEINPILWISVVLLIVTTTGILLNFIFSFLKMTLVETFVYEIKKWILSHLRKTSLIEYKKMDSTYLSKRIDEDSRQIVQFFTDNYYAVILKFIELVVVGILILTINFSLGSLMFILSPIYFLAYLFFRKLIFQKTLEAREETAVFFSKFTHQLVCLEHIIIESDFTKEDSSLNGAFSIYYQKFMAYVVVTAKLRLLQGFIVGIMQLLVFFIGGMSVLEGITSIGLLTTLMVYFAQILGNISYYTDLAKKYQINKTSLHRMDEILSLPEVEEGENKLNQVCHINANVTFFIDNKKVLDNIILEAQSNEVIGIVGGNGTGKSTLVKLLVGAIKAKSSEHFSIIFNNKFHISELDCVKLRENSLSYVPQRINFKDLTLGEVMNEVHNYKSSQDFITTINAESMILNEDISEFIIMNWSSRMNQLSGGDRQLVAILRSIAKKSSSLIIMDEPTVNLDMIRVDWFKRAMKQVKYGRIILIVTHENSIEEIFDKTINLD